MSRLNIEDSLFEDDKFIKLCALLKSEIKAIGWWVKTAQISQSYWKNNKELIPKEVYKWKKFPKQLIESKIVVEKENGYYFHGSEKNFAWIYSKVENGKKGGRPFYLKKSEKNNEKKSIKISKSNFNETTHKKTQDVDNTHFTETYGITETKPTDNPPTPTPTPTPTLIKNKSKSSFDFKSIYQEYPRKKGKQNGLIACERYIKSIKDYEDFSKAIDNFKDDCKTKGTKKEFMPHFSTFVNQHWRDWIEKEVDDPIAIPKEYENPFTSKEKNEK